METAGENRRDIPVGIGDSAEARDWAASRAERRSVGLVRTVAFVTQEKGHLRIIRHRVRSVPKLDDFENTFLLCYVRGPEGLIVELAERLDRAPG